MLLNVFLDWTALKGNSPVFVELRAVLLVLERDQIGGMSTVIGHLIPI